MVISWSFQTSFEPVGKKRKYIWAMQGKLQNLWLAEAKMLFPNTPPEVALGYMEQSFEGYKDMVSQEQYGNVLMANSPLSDSSLG